MLKELETVNANISQLMAEFSAFSSNIQAKISKIR